MASFAHNDFYFSSSTMYTYLYFIVPLVIMFSQNDRKLESACSNLFIGSFLSFLFIIWQLIYHFLACFNPHKLPVMFSTMHQNKLLGSIFSAHKCTSFRQIFEITPIYLVKLSVYLSDSITEYSLGIC